MKDEAKSKEGFILLTQSNAPPTDQATMLKMDEAHILDYQHNRHTCYRPEG